MITLTADKNLKISKLIKSMNIDIPYSNFNKLLRNKDIKVNGKRVSKDIEVSVGDLVEIYYVLQDKPLNVVYKDDNVLVVIKPKGIESKDFYQSVKKQHDSALFCHRLDRNTDGVMIFALNESAENEILLGFKEHTFIKKYHATVIGKPKTKSAILNAYLVKNSEKSLVKIYNQQVKNSVPIKTGYKVIKENGDTSLLEVTLYTGKTHQIRAHLAHIGHAIVGDGKYGDNNFNKQKKVKSQMLSAYSLTLSFNSDSCLFYLNGKTFCIE